MRAEQLAAHAARYARNPRHPLVVWITNNTQQFLDEFLTQPQYGCRDLDRILIAQAT
jgi:hypothetical protein